MLQFQGKSCEISGISAMSINNDNASKCREFKVDARYSYSK